MSVFGCMSGSIFIRPSSLNDTLAGYKILGSTLVSSAVLLSCTRCLLLSKVRLFPEPSRWFALSLGAFRIGWLSLIFVNCTLIRLGVNFSSFLIVPYEPFYYKVSKCFKNILLGKIWTRTKVDLVVWWGPDSSSPHSSCRAQAQSWLLHQSPASSLPMWFWSTSQRSCYFI